MNRGLVKYSGLLKNQKILEVVALDLRNKFKIDLLDNFQIVLRVHLGTHKMNFLKKTYNFCHGAGKIKK